jgi:Cu-Zn family superoxide dismutase
MKTFIVAAVAALPLAAAAGAQTAKPADAMQKTAPGAARAVAVLRSADTGKVEGTIWFEPSGSNVAVKARITGLTPGTHGFHVHEFGDCSAADFTSAGGHFNPMTQPHGAPTANMRHVGDLGNIEAGADGTATIDLKDAQLALSGMHGIVGRAVIVHAKADDLKTQPTGDAGGRLACGVIGIAK